jgi:CHASE3 domain sensor protein
MGTWNGSDAVRASVRELRETIEAYGQSAAAQTTQMLRLTWAIVGLTVVLVAGLGVQIWLVWPAH